MKMHAILASIIFGFGVVATPAALAGEWGNQMMSFPVGNDVYASGGNMTITENTSGDLLVMGGNVRITGNVSQDLAVAGGQVSVIGSIGDDLRAAGGNIEITGRVNGDVLVMGGTVVLGESSTILGDVVMLGGDIDIRGQIQGKLKVGAGKVHLSGSVAGGIDVEAETFAFNGAVSGQSTIVANQLDLGPNARLQGKLDYWTPDGEVDFSTALQGGSGATFTMELARTIHSQKEAAGAFAAFLGVWSIFSLLSSALVLLLLMFFLLHISKKAGEQLQRTPWKSLGIGFLYFAAVPVLSFILFMTVIGIPLGLFVLFAYFFSLFFGTAISALVLARWAESSLGTRWHSASIFGVAVAIIIALKLLWLLPLVGWLVKFILTCMTFGAFIHAKWSRLRPVA